VDLHANIRFALMALMGSSRPGLTEYMLILKMA